MGEFGAAFKGFMETAVAQAPAPEPAFVKLLREHLGTDPTSLPVVTEHFEPSDQPNLHLALEAYLKETERRAQLVGVLSPHKKYMGVSFADLLAPTAPGLTGGAPAGVGPVEYANTILHDGTVLTCLESALVLIGEADQRLAAFVRGPGERRGMGSKLQVEVMAATREQAQRFLSTLRTLMRTRNVYRGHVLALSLEMDRTVQVHFQKLATIARDQVILPAGVLERVERHTIGFARHRDKLRAARRHLKRGLLLHGAPGTGKTLTAMYLASQMTDRTVLLLTGHVAGLIPQSCALARTLEPAMLILEDVDLVAEERTREHACGPLLFDLLNEMDGLADDADIIFLLTTNRPDIVEPALAARPGRIDQSVEIPLPDAACRMRLLELYAQGLPTRITRWEAYVARTQGTSGAFIRELMRKAALFAADEGEELIVTERHMDEALHELVVEGGALTRSLLGARPAGSV